MALLSLMERARRPSLPFPLTFCALAEHGEIEGRAQIMLPAWCFHSSLSRDARATLDRGALLDLEVSARKLVSRESLEIPVPETYAR